MEKAGLTLVRTFRQSWPDLFNGEEQESVEYALERADWERQEAAGRERLADYA
jgi:RimJ/RimL family protein N-acetyltransferase